MAFGDALQLQLDLVAQRAEGTAPDTVLLLEHDPDFVFSCYALSRAPKNPRWNCNPRVWERRGYRVVTLHIPGLRERGEYYWFLVRAGRPFECRGVLDP